MVWMRGVVGRIPRQNSEEVDRVTDWSRLPKLVIDFDVARHGVRPAPAGSES